MPTSFRPYQPDQMLLLPPSLRDWLPPDHLAYFISDLVDRLDLSAFYRRYEGDGRRNQPFEPRMMVKVLVYGYATGTFSSRRLANRLHEDVAFRVLAAGNAPKHRTLCEFRQLHLEEFTDLFVQVVRVAQDAGLVKLGVLAIDGSKVKANASKHKAMSYGRMKAERQRLAAEIEAIKKLLETAEGIDAEEDARYGADFSGDELPEELRRRESRAAALDAAIARLEERQREQDRSQGRDEGDGRKSPRGGRKFKRDFGVPDDRKQDNFTDPDSRIMKSKNGFEQSYNAQVAVDEEHQLVVAAEVTQNAADSGQLLPVLDAVEANTGSPPERVLADSGYRSEDNFNELEGREIDGYVALGREGKKVLKASPDKFPATHRMADKLQTDQGRAQYRKRKSIAEAPFGWAKWVLGFRQFSCRGLRKAQAEWRLVCLALNAKRLSALLALA
jgi:transposase